MKAIKRIVYGMLALFVFIIVLAFILWMEPQIILSPSRVNRLFFENTEPYFSKRPDHVSLEIDSNGWNGKHIKFELPSFCTKTPDACFDQVRFELRFKITSFTKVKIERIGPIVIHNRYLVYREPPEEDEKPKEEKKSDSTLAEHIDLSELVIKGIDISFPKARLIRKEDDVTAKLNIHQDSNNALTLNARAANESKEILRLLIKTGLVYNQHNSFQTKLSFNDKIAVKGELDGSIHWADLTGDIQGQIQLRKLVSWIPLVTLDGLRISRDDRVRLSTGIEMMISPKFNVSPSRSALPRPELNTRIRGKVEATPEEGRMRYVMHLGPFQDHGFSGEVKTRGYFPSPPELVDRYGLSQLWIRFEIPQFQKLVSSLKKTSSAVPAPFSSLQGKIRLLAGQERGDWQGNTLPISLITDLDSKEQSFKTQSEAKITLAQAPKKTKIVGESLIQKIRFTLPNLKLLEPAPQIRPDPRMKTKEKQREIAEEKKEPPQKSTVDLRWVVRTTPGGIQFFYPVLKPSAAMEGSWIVGKNGGGEFHFLPFGIEYMNRHATVKKLRFFQTPGEYTLSYDGVMQITKADYKISILINRVGEKPVVQLQSEPPLGEDDIISLILFNQTSDELDPDQSNSVASTQAAVANRALGLFSIFALSNTPVEAVSFNPSTGVYSARVKLASGLTATVGTDWENTQEVALRKRLGKNWILSTVLSDDDDPKSETARRTMVEWFRRF